MLEFELVRSDVAAARGHFDLHFDFGRLVARVEYNELGVETLDFVLAGEDIPAETMNTAIQALRSERATIVEAKKAKEPAAPIDLTALFTKKGPHGNGSDNDSSP